jgi:hypothetical protein
LELIPTGSPLRGRRGVKRRANDPSGSITDYVVGCGGFPKLRGLQIATAPYVTRESTYGGQ